MMTPLEPTVLQGRHATLEPIKLGHEDEIKRATSDGDLWKLWFTTVPTPDNVRAYIEQLLTQREQGRALPFVVRDASNGQLVGATRYLNIDPPNRRLEIGGTWYAQRAQRTGINTECKLMLLTHAFEVLECIAVEFRTDWFNKRSQAAIERLGAKRDGILRNHMVMADGRIRDTVVYSIIQNEWAGVKMNLQHKLHRG
jgi:RimJ/RimL family protein N-acetyltransferase